MALTFNMLLVDAGLDPREVRLLRHQQAAATGLIPFALWRDDPAEFVVSPDGSTLFVGL